MEATVSASSVNVRSGPSTSKKLLGRLNHGETFSYSSDQNGWLQTQYKNQTAYVCKKYTTTSGSTSAAPAPATATESAAPATESAASAPAASTASASVNINVSAAVSYNKKRGYSKAKWMEIQSKVGTTADGIPGANIAKAIAVWQQANGLQVDGKCGPGTLAAMNLGGSTSTTTPTTTTPTTTPTATTTTPTTTPTATTTTPTTTTPTATPETPTTTPETPTTVGEKILTSTQVSSAIDYNVGQNLSSIWKQIQGIVGTDQTGKIDEVSVQAIAVWQRDNGLEADGKFGKKSLAKAGLTKPSSSSSSVAYGTKGPGGLVYADNNYVRQNQDPSTEKEVVDLKTGKRFKIYWKAPGGSYHSDVNPWDKPSTDTYKSFVNPNVSPDDKNYWSKGSHWSWKGRPGALKLNSNTWISCGFHTRPHGSRQGANPDYPFTQSSANNRPSGTTSEDEWRPGGHFCLYYNETNRGGTKGCREAAEQAKNMQCPE